MWKIVFTAFAALSAVGLAGMVGGFRDMDVNDAGAQNALNFAVVEHNKRSNDIFLSQVTEVVRVQSQVVAGIKYLITVNLGKTPCRKGGANEVCAIHQVPEKALGYQCTFTVYSRPWDSHIQLLDQQCSKVN